MFLLVSSISTPRTRGPRITTGVTAPRRIAPPPGCPARPLRYLVDVESARYWGRIPTLLRAHRHPPLHFSTSLMRRSSPRYSLPPVFPPHRVTTLAALRRLSDQA